MLKSLIRNKPTQIQPNKTTFSANPVEGFHETAKNNPRM